MVFFSVLLYTFLVMANRVDGLLIDFPLITTDVHTSIHSFRVCLVGPITSICTMARDS